MQNLDVIQDDVHWQSLRINRELKSGRVGGQLANPGSRGKMAVKTVCVRVSVRS